MTKQQIEYVADGFNCLTVKRGGQTLGQISAGVEDDGSAWYSVFLGASFAEFDWAGDFATVAAAKRFVETRFA